MNQKLIKNYETKLKKDKNKIAQLLKRKRIELGLTLEEASDGICSTSYLSKIENCIVDVDDVYYNLLFERLHIEYSEVLNSRLVPTYQESLKAYLQNDLKFLEKYISNLFNNQMYCEIEVELFVLFYNILNHHLEESTDLIKRIKSIYKSLSPEETDFFKFLEVLYNIELNEYEELDKNIRQLCKMSFSDKTLALAVLDISLDYFFFVKDVANFFHYVKELDNYEIYLEYNRVYLKHELQGLVLRYKDEEVFDKFTLLKSKIHDNLDIFNYYYCYYLYLIKHYEEAIDYLKEVKINVDLLAILSLLIDHVKEPNLYYFFLNISIVKNMEYKGFFKFLIDYYTLKFKQMPYSYLFNFVKHYIQDSYQAIHESLYYKSLEEEYIKLCYETGHYKEVVKYLLKKYNEKNENN